MTTQTKAVLFDLGGTLFTYRHFERARREGIALFASWFGIAPAAVDQAFLDAAKVVWPRLTELPYYLHRDLGRQSRMEAARILGVELSAEREQEYHDFAFARQCEGFELRPGVFETLTELRQRGLHLGIVSNADRYQIAPWVNNSGLESYFDSILCSEEAQSCKPDAAIYHEALRRAGCAPAEALFIGDTPDHDIAGANAVGLRSVLIIEHTEMGLPRGDVAAHHTIRELPEILALV
ncbi:MAG: HAD family hydrolase [Dehalococcoidia bacterium]